MILVDTSVWVDHFRSALARLQEVLLADEVVCHPFVIGELSLGILKRRAEVLSLLSMLPKCPIAADEEVMSLVETERLYGRGIGWIDAHLLGSARLGKARLWTRDKALLKTARSLEVAFEG